MTRERILAAARAWLGTPFHHAARIKGVGVDCLHFVVAVYQEVGLLPAGIPLEDYPRDWHLHQGEERYLKGVMNHADLTDDPQPGDIALFKFGRCVSHAALVVEWPRVIHSLAPHGVMESDAEHDAELRGRLHSFWTVVK